MNNGISKITYAHDITLVTLSALPCDSKAIANVLTAMSNAEVNVDMISQTAPQGGHRAERMGFTADGVLGLCKQFAHGMVSPSRNPASCRPHHII